MENSPVFSGHYYRWSQFSWNQLVVPIRYQGTIRKPLLPQLSHLLHAYFGISGLRLFKRRRQIFRTRSRINEGSRFFRHVDLPGWLSVRSWEARVRVQFSGHYHQRSDIATDATCIKACRNQDRSAAQALQRLTNRVAETTRQAPSDLGLVADAALPRYR